jgi:hypothetical protein
MKKIFREKKHDVVFDVFGYVVHVIFTTDLQRSRDKYNALLGHSYDATGAGAFHTYKDERDYNSYLFFKWDADVEQITHESWHVIRRMMEFLGAKHENEVMAYHIGHLAGCIHRFQQSLSKRRKKNGN